jgi:hypothetical protein
MEKEPTDNHAEDTRQEKRAKKLHKKKARIKQHGKSLAQMYKDAIEKRKRGEKT